MSHDREVFPILENIENEKGEVVHRLNEGDRPVADDLTTKKNGLIGFSFKDKDGRVVLPQLDPEGNIKVSFDKGISRQARGVLLAGIKATFDVGGDIDNHALIVEIPLTIDRIYNSFTFEGRCLRDTEYLVQLVNDEGQAGETIITIHDLLTGPGQFKDSSEPQRFEINTAAAGGSYGISFAGVVKLRIVAANINKASRITSFISMNEVEINSSPNP